ncbi:MAG: hypothetical protein ABIO91_03155 [Pyrinomonadaceae bacterium]
MDNTNKLSAEELKMQSFLEAFLLSRKSLKSSAAETSFHVDEDFLAAFTEGNLGERESMPIVSHLIDCGFCRHKTAELVRLSVAFESGEDEIRPISSAEPHRVSEVLSGILSKIFGTADGAVFAHNEDEAGDKAGEETVETTEDE